MAPRIVAPDREVPGDQGQKLEQADIQGVPVADLGNLFNGKVHKLIMLFQDNEKDPVDDQHGRHHVRVIQVCVQDLVQKETHHSCRKAGDEDLESTDARWQAADFLSFPGPGFRRLK